MPNLRDYPGPDQRTADRRCGLTGPVDPVANNDSVVQAPTQLRTLANSSGSPSGCSPGATAASHAAGAGQRAIAAQVCF